jgi:hypothetical protein
MIALGTDVAFWHNSDMPRWSLNVRCWVNSGSHMLALSFSGFDPKRIQTAFRSHRTLKKQCLV